MRCNSEVPPVPGTESEEAIKFLKSLQGLRELRSQIHYAADYCETAFLDANEKNTVMDSTREYICRAVVTVVDHLGCVSANLDSRLRWSDSLSKAELQINCLKQKVLLHEQYNQTLVLSKLGQRVVLPRHFSRYISPPLPNQEEPKDQFRVLQNSDDAASSTQNKREPKIKQDLPLFMSSSNNNSYKIPLYRTPSLLDDAESNRIQSLSSALPVRDGLSIPQETKKVAFHFEMTRKHGRRILQWRWVHENEILSLIRPSKKQPLRLLKLK